MTIQTTTTDRRTMVQEISEHLGPDAVYAGAPSFAYNIGELRVERDNSIHSEDLEALEALKPFLLERGYIEAEPEDVEATDSEATEPEPEEPDTLQTRIPIEGMTCNQLKNLMHTLYTHQYLLNKVTRDETFVLPDDLITRLADNIPETVMDFETLLEDYKARGELSGIGMDEGTFYMNFPRSEAADKNLAYVDLACALVTAARNATRVKAIRLEPENEKYVLRSWLVRMGFGGVDLKASRNALLNGLKGHTAFRTEEAAAKHKEKYAEIRSIHRQLREESENE